MRQHTRDGLEPFSAASSTTIEAITREPQRGATGAIATPTPADHRIPYLAVLAENISWRPQSQFFNHVARPSRTKTGPTSQKHEYSLKGSLASSTSLLRARRFWASFAHPRDPEGDSFLAWAAKAKQRLAAARTRRHKPSLSSTLGGVSRALCDLPCFSISHTFEEQCALSSIGNKYFFVAKYNPNWKNDYRVDIFFNR